MKKALKLLVSSMLVVSMSAAALPSVSAATVSTAPQKPASPSSPVMDPYTGYDKTVTFTKAQRVSNLNIPKGDSIENNAYTRWVKSKINVQPKVAWEVASDAYNQKMALSIASGDIPDIAVVSRTMFDQLVENDLVQPLDEVIEKCLSPFLKEQYESYGDRIWTGAYKDGKLMGLPGTTIGYSGKLLWVRQDWLDALGLKAPKTWDDIVHIAKEFIEKDPGKNGPGKTIGLGLWEEVGINYNGQHGLDSLFILHDAYPRVWVYDENGDAMYGTLSQNMKKPLEIAAQLYKDGIIDREFAVKKGSDREAMVSSGRVGLIFAPWWGGGGMTLSHDNNPDANWIPYQAPLDEKGNLKSISQDPWNSVLTINKNYKNPEAVIKALNLDNDLMRGHGDKEVLDAFMDLNKTSPGMSWSTCTVPIQVDYDDAIKRVFKDLKPAVDKKNRDLIKLPFALTFYDAIMRELANPGKVTADWNAYRGRYIGQDVATRQNVQIYERSFAGTTETMALKGASLKKLEDEMLIKIIMGEKPVSYFDEFVKLYNRIGGAEITEEVNEFLANAKK